MEVSVIIPVYNAGKYIEKAVESALTQKQTKEIILIEDGSKDNSLDKCKLLEQKHSIVKLFTHSDNINKGISASRNLGIKLSKYSYIAFLDADDFFLPDFFDKAENIFNIYPEAEGVFGSIGAYYYNNKAKIKHLKRTGQDKTGLNIDYNPEKDNLFNILIKPQTGHLPLVGIVFKKQCLKKTGLFDNELKQGEDTDFIWRLSLLCKLYPLNKDMYVAMRGVHNNNNVFNIKEYEYYKYIVFKKWLKNITQYKISSKSTWFLLRRYLSQHPIVIKYEKFVIIRVFLKIIITTSICIQNPYICYSLIFKNNNK